MMSFYMSMIDTEENKTKFELIYEKYHKLMFYIAYQILKDNPLSEDAVHDSFVKIIENLSSNLHSKTLTFGTASQRKAFLFGVAMHIATDVFAHSTYERTSTSSPWTRIKHTGTPARADDPTVKPRRYIMALRVERNTLYRFQQKRTDVPFGHDFHASGDTTGEFYSSTLPVSEQYVVANLYENASDAGVTNTTVLNHYSMISFINSNYTEANGD